MIQKVKFSDHLGTIMGVWTLEADLAWKWRHLSSVTRLFIPNFSSVLHGNPPGQTVRDRMSPTAEFHHLRWIFCSPQDVVIIILYSSSRFVYSFIQVRYSTLLRAPEFVIRQNCNHRHLFVIFCNHLWKGLVLLCLVLLCNRSKR